MIKKILACLLTLLLLPAFAGAEAAALTAEELDAWSRAFLLELADSMAEPVLTENGYEAKVGNATLYLGSADVSTDTPVLGAVIDTVTDESRQCPRGIMPSNSLEALLGVYPNDNAALAGTRDKAVLYLYGSLPGAVSAGIVLRDGQRVTVVEHCLYLPGAYGVAREGMVYSLENNTVNAVRMYRSDTLLTMDEARAEITDLASVQGKDEYFAYSGQNSVALEREDFTFGGIDFFDAEPESVISVLGKPASDTAMEDSTGGQFRIMEWTDVQITFLYSAAGDFLYADILTVNGGSADGPRGLRTGDSLDTVLSRFPRGDKAQEGDRALLYGDGEIPPYGIAEYGSGYATIHYAITQNGRKVELILSFEDGRLVSMMAVYL
jgi:hypothetical protein